MPSPSGMSVLSSDVRLSVRRMADAVGRCFPGLASIKGNLIPPIRVAASEIFFGRPASPLAPHGTGRYHVTDGHIPHKKEETAEHDR